MVSVLKSGLICHSCERKNEWLDEAHYAIDTSTIPRGGHNRRKSMEPKMLANLDGTLIASETPKATVEKSPTAEFLNLSAVTSHEESAMPTPRLEVGEESVLPQTPTPGAFDFADGNLSPTTPYYMSQGAQLIQQTCPPKQSMQSLFPVSGNIDDEPDATVRQKLMKARRKSLQWAPRVGSPLGINAVEARK